METRDYPCIFFAFTFCLSINLSQVLSASNPNMVYQWNIPAWIPKPVIPVDNPMTKEKVKLGRHLFYEKRLSVNKEFSCASCHIQAFAFSDPKPVAVGATGEKHPRNSMTLANVAYNSVLTWAHPGMKILEIQAIIPMFGEIPVEMGLTDKEKVVQMLREDVNYQKMFAAAFGKGDDKINLNNLTKALASFQRSLISANSPYDNYRYGGKINAISQAAKRREKLFNSERLQCFKCHSGFNFSDSIRYKHLKKSKNSNVEKINFHNTGLYNIDEKGSYPANSTGVHGITNKPARTWVNLEFQLCEILL